MAPDLRAARLEELRARLAQGQDAYRRAREQIRSDEWAKKELEAFAKLVELIAAFQPGDSGEKAVFVLGQCQGVLLERAGPFLVIADHEALRDQAAKLEAVLKGE